MKRKQTAVEFFMEELLKLEVRNSNGKKLSTIDYINKRYAINKQALQMEREQIEEAHLAGQNSADLMDGETEIEYYTQTYGECTHKS